MPYNNYTTEQKEEIIKAICENVIINSISFNKAIEQSEISRLTFYQWIAYEDKLKDLYNYAREIRADTLFEEIIDISDNTEEGVEITEKPQGTEIKKGDMTNHRRLKIDSRKWVVARMLPKKYGDKAELDLTTKGESLNDVSKMSTEELIKRAKAIKNITNDKT